ncbi:MAG: outer membrane lipoprotein-sorting protein [Gammaproteobacteria bacterium]|nr:outer membrane lipoprotein-sorting protein [Gammaproteobacteria bacterium]
MCALLILAACMAATAAAASAPAKLSASEIVTKNVAARGGLEAWRAVKTMSLSGKMAAGGNQRATLQLPTQAQATVVTRKTGEPTLPTRRTDEIYLPFLMELARPDKMRFELQVGGKTALQVYDGVNGWKLRPYLNRLEVEPYSDDETKAASKNSDLDGPLVDYAAKGTRIESEGIEKVENRDTYKLKLTLKSGAVTHVWVDAQTFLETKVEGQPRRLDGTDHPVEVYYRDYRNVNGLQVPFVLETRVLPVARTAMGRDTPVPPEKTLIEKVEINPKFDAGLFSKPAIPTGSTAGKG